MTGSAFTFTGGTSGLSFAGAGTTQTLGGTLALANGGTNANLTATVNNLVYSTTSAMALLATANNAILNTNGSGVPSLATSPSISGSYISTGGNLQLPATNAGLTEGVIVIGGQNTFQAYSPVAGQENLFVGYLSGNGTNTGAQNYGFGKYTLNVLTSGSENIAIGPACMKFGAVSGIGNVGIGSHSGSVISSGSYNTFIGFQTAPLFDSGSYNVILGQNSASSYINTESSNILLSSAGVVADSHTIRIGTQGSGNGQQNLAFMAGINGVTVSNAVPVMIDTTTGQLGVGSGSSGITTINGDSGSITGSTVTIYANTSGNATGSSVSFTNSGTTSTFSLIDPNNNMFLGFNAGNATNSGTSNVIIGPNAGFTLSTGNANIGLGDSSFSFLDTGTGNIGIGRQAGFQYISSESYNILIGNPGTSGESNVIRIGDQGSGSFQQNQAFMAGINGVTVSNAVPVMIDSTTGQLGVGSVITQGIVTINGDSGSITGSTVTIFANQASNLTGQSVSFTNSSATSTFSLTDAGNNIMLGLNSGTGSSGSNNIFIGKDIGVNYQGSDNIGIGVGSLTLGTTGSLNIGIGSGSGAAYITSESTNVCINSPGVVGDNQTIRISDPVSAHPAAFCFIGGIAGVTVSNTLPVVIDSTTGQLGTLANSPITSVVTQTFIASGTYTPTTGMVFCQIICVSGGGGGGGADSTGAVDSVGSGGGAGGVAIGIFTAAAIGGTPVVTVGAGGAGGVGIAGSNGGASLVTGVITINGGTGGLSSIAQDVVGGPGGTPIGGGDVQITGGDGGMGMYIGPASIYGGTGGLNGYGYPSTAVSAGSTAFAGGPGNPGNGFGSGGGGAVAVTANPGKQNGGAGASGIIYITEYISA